jgi:thioredoxin-like negative regulator of GroEL
MIRLFLFYSFQNRALFAYVNVDRNPIIQKRFHIFNLPTFIL